MADEVEGADDVEFATEHVPDVAYLFQPFHVRQYESVTKGKRGNTAALIQQHGDDGVSCDWNKYRSLEESIGGRGQEPEKYGAVVLNVGRVRSEGNAHVAHDPIPEGAPFGPNRAHSLIQDPDSDPKRGFMKRAFKQEVRVRLFGLVEGVVRPGDPVPTKYDAA